MLIRKLIAASAIFCILGASTATAAVLDPPETDEPDCVINLVTGQCELAVDDDGDPPSGSGKVTPGTEKAAGSRCVFKAQTVPCRTADGFLMRPRVLPDAAGRADIVGELELGQ